MHQARFVHKDPVADGIYSFRFRLDRPIDFIPGQFIELSIPHDQADNRGEKRWFSISSAQNNEHIEITTKIDTQSPSTYKQALQKLSENSQVSISEPMGDFILPRKNDRPIIFLLAGVGTAPAHSIISSAPDTVCYSFITAKKRSSMPFVDFFERKSAKSYLFETSRGRRLTAEHVQQSIPETIWQNGLFFIAGPEQFCQSIKNDLSQQGVSARRCLIDYFHGYNAI